jgi:excinuclease UvrABC nuclease subunit
VIAYRANGIYSTVNVLFVRNGRMLGGKNFSFESAAISDAVALEEFVLRYYKSDSDIPDEIICGEEIESADLLEKYGLNKQNDTTPITDDYSKTNLPKKENLFSKQIQKIFSKQKKVKLCNKYGISIFNWISFNIKISLSDEMKSAV